MDEACYETDHVDGHTAEGDGDRTTNRRFIPHLVATTGIQPTPPPVASIFGLHIAGLTTGGPVLQRRHPGWRRHLYLSFAFRWPYLIPWLTRQSSYQWRPYPFQWL